jgi:hypothetical protein
MPSDQPASLATVSLSFGTSPITLELSLILSTGREEFTKLPSWQQEAIVRSSIQSLTQSLSLVIGRPETTSATNPSPSSSTSSECSSMTPPPSSTPPAGVEQRLERPKGYMDDEPSDSKSTQPPPRAHGRVYCPSCLALLELSALND